MRLKTGWLAFALVVTPAALPLSGASAQTPQLDRYVPSSVHFSVAWYPTEEYLAVLRPYGKAFRRLIDSGIGEDLFRLATHELPPERRVEIRRQIDRFLDLCRGVDWKSLFSGEGVYAGSVAVPFPEYLLILRPGEEAAAARFRELRGFLDGLRGFGPPDVLTLVDSKVRGADVATLYAEGFPVQLAVARRGDLVYLTTSDRLLRDSLDLVAQTPDSGVVALTEAEGFKRALRDLPQEVFARSYFNLAAYMGFFRGMIAFAKAQAPQDDANAQGALSAAETVVEEIQRLASIASVGWAKDGTVFSETRVALKRQEDGSPGFIESLLAGQRSLQGALRVVPYDAKAFFMTAGVDFAKLYDGIVDLLRERIPRAGEALERWERLQERIGFNLRRDLLSWLEGGCGWISLPKEGGGSDCVVFFRVRDDERARELVDRCLEAIERFLESRGHEVDYVPVEGLGEDFREIRISTLPFLRPVIGRPQGVVVFGTSASALLRIRDTMQGSARSIAENPRFAPAGVPEGHICELYYQRLDGALEGLAKLVGIAGFVATFAPPEGKSEPLYRLGSVLAKLGRFLHDVDLGRDAAGWTLYDPDTGMLVQRQFYRLKLEAPEKEEF